MAYDYSFYTYLFEINSSIKKEQDKCQRKDSDSNQDLFGKIYQNPKLNTKDNNTILY